MKILGVKMIIPLTYVLPEKVCLWLVHRTAPREWAEQKETYDARRRWEDNSLKCGHER